MRVDAPRVHRGANRVILTPMLTRPQPRVVRNTRASLDRDTCGQAAVATVLATLGVGPFAGDPPLGDAEAIDLVRAAYPPDLPFGLGTSAGRIAAALRGHGVPARVIHAGMFGIGAAAAWDQVRARVQDGVPVPVCVDDGRIGGIPWGAHWAIVIGATAERVRLGNAAPHGELPLARFVAAWRCRQLPWPYDCCAVLAGR